MCLTLILAISSLLCAPAFVSSRLALVLSLWPRGAPENAPN